MSVEYNEDEMLKYPIPRNMMTAELEGIYGSAVLSEMNDIMKCYNIYEKGAKFFVESNGDYVPANMKYKIARSLLDKEVRFMFSKPIEFTIEGTGKDSLSETDKEKLSTYQAYIDKVLKSTLFNGKILKGGKDCLIGKRIAIMVNFNADSGIKINICPSLEFVYETDIDDIDTINKIVCFYTVKDDKDNRNKRIFKKKYWMENGFCHISEGTYDGNGTLVETIEEDLITEFPYIPGIVIVNDGLTGDTQGSSEIEQLMDYESWFSRLANNDMDAERKGMNPIRYTVDMDSNSTAGLSINAGAFWDLTSDQNLDNPTPQVGVLENDMGYSAALDTTLKRIKSMMHEQIDVPEISSEALKGIVTSGKSLKGIYWGLIVRCDEKMLAWKPALEQLIQILIDGAKYYPEIAEPYMNGGKLEELEYSIKVENNYPLPEDEAEEKQVDLSEVNAQTMSKKAYMRKWRGLTDTEADDELRQIALERELLDNSFGFNENTDAGNKDDEQLEDDEQEII